MTSTDAASRPDSAQAIGDLTFEGLKDSWTILSEVTLEDWLDEARSDFVMLRVAATLTGENDDDLEAKIRSSGDLQPWFEFLDSLEPWRKRSRALIDLCDAAEARLFIVLARVLDADPDC